VTWGDSCSIGSIDCSGRPCYFDISKFCSGTCNDNKCRQCNNKNSESKALCDLKSGDTCVDGLCKGPGYSSWRFLQSQGGIKSHMSNKCLDAERSSVYSTKTPPVVQMWDCHKESNQLWKRGKIGSRTTADNEFQLRVGRGDGCWVQGCSGGETR